LYRDGLLGLRARLHLFEGKVVIRLQFESRAHAVARSLLVESSALRKTQTSRSVSIATQLNQFGLNESGVHSCGQDKHESR
jgi:hypothetical protein